MVIISKNKILTISKIFGKILTISKIFTKIVSISKIFGNVQEYCLMNYNTENLIITKKVKKKFLDHNRWCDINE